MTRTGQSLSHHVEEPLDPAQPSTPSMQRTAAPDAEIVRRMAAGDERALGALYGRWADRVFSVAAYILRDDQAAADVVEETFWQAWRSAGDFREARGTVGSWLLLISRSRALEQHRTLRRRKDRLALAAGDVPISLSCDVLEQVEASERRAIVTRALGGLPPDQLRVVELAFFRGLSHTEIAEETKQPLGTVKTRIRLALDKLRECLSFLREEGR